MFFNILFLIVGGLGLFDGLTRVLDVEWLMISFEVPDDEIDLFIGIIEVIVGAIVVFFTLMHMRGRDVTPGPGRRAEVELWLAMAWPVIARVQMRVQSR